MRLSYEDPSAGEIPLVLRLDPSTPALPMGRLIERAPKNYLDRLVLAQRPRLQEASDHNGAAHPSRWYVCLEGAGVFGWIRGHLQVSQEAPRVVMEDHPSNGDFGARVVLGDHRGTRPVYTVWPIPEGGRSLKIGLGSVPVLNMDLSGWFGDGVDLKLSRLPECPALDIRVFPLQVGRDFTFPPADDHFLIGSSDLALYNSRRG